MLLKNIVLASLFFLIIIHYATSVDMQCEYKNDDFDSFANQYSCLVQADIKIYNKETAINLIRGTHKSYKTDNDVLGISIRDKKTHYMPTNLGEKFKNLNFIRLRQGRLVEIHQSDLKVFPKLRYLNLDANDIETLDEDLFQFNPLLEVVWFEGNKIRVIGYSTFDELTKLRDLDLSGNTCESKRGTGYTQVAELKTKIKQSCFDAAAEITKLKNQAKDLSESNLKLSAEVGKFNAEILQKSEEIQSLKNTLKNSTDQFSAKEQEMRQIIEESERQFQEKEKKLALATTQLKESLAQKIEILEQLKRLEENFKNSKSDALKKEEKLQERIDQLETQLDGKQVNLTYLEEKLRNSEILSNRTSESLRGLQNKLADLKKIESELRLNKSELEDRLETKEIDYENVTGILTNYSMRLLDYEQQITELDSKYNESASKLSKINAEYSELSKKLINVTFDKEKFQNDLKNLSRKLEKAEIDFEDLLALNDELSQQLTNQTQAAEALTEHSANSYSLELIFIVIGTALIALLTIANIVFAMKFYRQKTVTLRPTEFENSCIEEMKDQYE